MKLKDIKPNPELIVLIGLPGVGKSYIINDIIHNNPQQKYHIASTDNIIDAIAKEQGKTYSDVFQSEFKNANKPKKIVEKSRIIRFLKILAARSKAAKERGRRWPKHLAILLLREAVKAKVDRNDLIEIMGMFPIDTMRKKVMARKRNTETTVTATEDHVEEVENMNEELNEDSAEIESLDDSVESDATDVESDATDDFAEDAEGSDSDESSEDGDVVEDDTDLDKLIDDMEANAPAEGTGKKEKKAKKEKKEKKKSLHEGMIVS